MITVDVTATQGTITWTVHNDGDSPRRIFLTTWKLAVGAVKGDAHSAYPEQLYQCDVLHVPAHGSAKLEQSVPFGPPPARAWKGRSDYNPPEDIATYDTGQTVRDGFQQVYGGW